MYESEYAVAALLDHAGRVAVASEYVAAGTNLAPLCSLSVEEHINKDEIPYDVLMARLKRNLGITEDIVSKMQELLATKDSIPLNNVVNRKISTFVYQIPSRTTFRITRPKCFPMNFYYLDRIMPAIRANKFKLSFAATHMLSILQKYRKKELKDYLR